jgi:phytoene/squalene synthetase
MSKQDTAKLAGAITREASKQTYYTIRLLVDRDLVADAYRAYAYFRWVDDILDAETGSKPEKMAFAGRQQSILELCYRGGRPDCGSLEEQMLVDLIENNREKNSGLRSYLYNMMAVMVFDAERRWRTISQSELSSYSHFLATAVTDALHYFIGHDCPAPCSETRYQAVYGAHITHMLRDMLADTASGYFNIPREYMQAAGMGMQDADSPAYRDWIRSRVQLARLCFKEGREYIQQVNNLRCRLAGFAYSARFEWLLHVIERDGYRLRSDYPERKSLAAGLWMGWMILASTFSWSGISFAVRKLALPPVQKVLALRRRK